MRERFGTGLSDLRLTRVNYRFNYPFGPAEVVEFFRNYYGPTTRAFAALGETDRATLRAELGICGHRTIWPANRAAPRSTRSIWPSWACVRDSSDAWIAA